MNANVGVVHPQADTLRVIRADDANAQQMAVEVWRHRRLLYFLVWRAVKVRYKQTAIGAAWAVLQPGALALVFAIIFGRLAGFPSDGLPRPVFFLTTLLPWTYFSAALIGATGSLADNQHLITKVYFPRVLLPMAAVLIPLVDMAIAAVLLGGALAVYGIPLAATTWLVPLVIAHAVFVAFAAGLWLSAANAYFRDVRHAVPFVMQLLMFASPVVYPASLVPEAWRTLYALNPMVGVIEGFRWCLVGTSPWPPVSVAVSAVVTLGLLAGGLAFFQRVEGTLADVL